MTGQLKERNCVKRKRDENHGQGLTRDQGEQAPREISFELSKGVLQEFIHIHTHSRNSDVPSSCRVVRGTEDHTGTVWCVCVCVCVCVYTAEEGRTAFKSTQGYKAQGKGEGGTN